MEIQRAPQHCFDCGHVKQKRSFSRYHVPSLPRARQSPSNIGAGGEGGADGAARAKMFLPQETLTQSIKVAR